MSIKFGYLLAPRKSTPRLTGSFIFMQSFAVLVAIALPWLNPFSFGPSPPVVQWLVTCGSLAFMLLWAGRANLADVIVKAWLVAALISAVLGLLQYFGASAALQPWVNATETGEAYANLRQRNQFATLTNIGLASLLSLLYQNHANALQPVAGAGSAACPWRIAAILAAALLALGNAASSSRTGLLQLLMLLAMGWIWHPTGFAKWRSAQGPVLLSAVLAYIAGAYALPTLAGLDSNASGILARLQDGDSRCLGRLTLWSNVLHLIAQKPWLGWGSGELDFAHFVTLYPGERFCDILDNAHNLPLHLAVELGVPVAAALCGFAAWLILRGKPWRETDATRQLAWAVLGLILLHSLLEYPLWYGPFQMAAGLGVFLLWRPSDPRSWPSGVSVLTAFSLLAAVLYAGWDYRRISQIYQTPAMRAEAYREDTLEKAQDSWLFRNQVRFAELTITTLTPENAAHIHDLATDLLHFSPEPRVIEKLIDSATLLGLDEERQFYLARYQAAFAKSHALWLQENAGSDAVPAAAHLDESAP